MGNISQNSYNTVLKGHIMSIVNDCQEWSIDQLRDQIFVNFGLLYNQDYKNMHLNNALSLLKKEGRLKSAGRGKYVINVLSETSTHLKDKDAEINSENLLDSTESKNPDILPIKQEFIELVSHHYQECLTFIQKIDFVNASDKEYHQIEAMINYKNALSAKIMELKEN